MKKLLVAIAFLTFVTSCSPSGNLYNWGRPHNSDNFTRYDELSYNLYDKQSPEDICELVCFYDYLVTHPGGARNVVPPGICAEYGYLLLKPETAGIFAQYASKSQRKTFGDTGDYTGLFHDKGIEMLEREMELYPESVTFLTPILQQMNN